MIAGGSDGGGEGFAPLDVLLDDGDVSGVILFADVDISELQAKSEEDEAGSDELEVHEREKEDESDDSRSRPKRGRRTERRRLQLVASARRHRNRKKSEKLGLQEEAAFLERQLEILRRQRKNQLQSASVAQWEERAIVERLQRRRAESINQQLRAAVYQNRHYVGNLHSVFSSSPMVSSELDLQQLLHSYSHLGLSAASRLRECRELCTNTRLDRAMHVLVRETDGMSLEAPSITTRKVHLNDDQFGVTCMGVYALDTVDVDRIFAAASKAILGFGSQWPEHALTSSTVQLVDSPAESIRYGIFGTRYQNNSTADEVVLGGRLLSYYRVTGSYIVALWDFVDKDDMYPLPSDVTIRRDVTGAMLLRQEICSDGVQRVVCRSACTKHHTFQPSARRSKGAERFGELMTLGAKVCGTEMYNAVKEGEVVRYPS